MGVDPAVDRALALHDSNGWIIPLEFSLVAVFPFGVGDLRRGSASSKAGVSDPGYNDAWPHSFDQHRSVRLPHRWFLRSSADLDFYWTGCDLDLFGTPATQFRTPTLGAGGDHVLRFPRHISLHADKLRSSAIQFVSRTA